MARCLKFWTNISTELLLPASQCMSFSVFAYIINCVTWKNVVARLLISGTHRKYLCNVFLRVAITAKCIFTSLGSVYRNTEPIFGMLKYRYRYRRRYLQYRKIPNTDNKIPSRFGFSVFVSQVLAVLH